MKKNTKKDASLTKVFTSLYQGRMPPIEGHTSPKQVFMSLNQEHMSLYQVYMSLRQGRQLLSHFLNPKTSFMSRRTTQVKIRINKPDIFLKLCEDIIEQHNEQGAAKPLCRWRFDRYERLQQPGNPGPAGAQ